MYLDKKELHDALTEYLLKCEEAEASGNEKPKMPEYIGECIILVAKNLAKRHNFSGYSFKDDMIDNAIELCIRYIKNYDFRKYSNPHVFLTQYAWRGFVDVINLEEDQAYLKAKLSISPDELSAALQDVDSEFHPEADDITTPYFDIEDYERRKFKKQPKQQDEIIGLETFIEE